VLKILLVFAIQEKLKIASAEFTWWNPFSYVN
jgi:hypothetical protein